VHIVHVACAEGVDAIARAKAEGVRITAETCPHYLTFAAEEIPDGATEFKCAPPIREARHRDALWAGLRSGALDLVATDHSPAPPSMKCPGDFMKAWGGIASLEMSLATVSTGARAFSTSAREQTERATVDAPKRLRREGGQANGRSAEAFALLAQWMSAAP